jgi:hypothetical protein
MNVRIALLLCGLAALSLAGPNQARAQAVAVTVRLDTNVLATGQTTTLRVFAQVTPGLRATADRIFSWYVDVLNTNGAAATALYNSMVKTASDNNAQTSATGTADGAHRRGIYDTFLNRPGAGVSNAVELMALPVQATAAGVTRFSVRAGTSVPFLAEDFIVAPRTGGNPFTGGDYTLAHADLTVTSGCSIQLQVQRVGGGGPNQRLQLQFTPCAGRNHTVESRFPIESGAWLPVAGAPHNSGSVTVTNNRPSQIFRVRVD